MTLLATALELARGGLAVFPCARDKKPAIPKKQGGHGWQDASTDPIRIREMFLHANAVLVGVPTGELSGFDALDLDYRHGAGEWEAAHPLPETRVHQTKSGGRHFLFRHAGGVRNSASKIADGVDVRGDGGYIIMPPSRGYSIISDSEIAEWPDWLLTLILARPPEHEKPRLNSDPVTITSKRLDGFIKAIQARISGCPEGGKHFALRNAAISLGGIQRAADLSDSQAVKLLLDPLPASVQDWENAKNTAAWGLEQGRKRPIQLEDRPQYQQRPNGHTAPETPPPDHHPHNFDGLDTSDTPLQVAEKRTIRVLNGLRHVAADAGLDAMTDAGVPFYQRDKLLVRAAVVKAKAADGGIVEVPSIVQVTHPVLARALGQSAEWERVNKDGEPVRIDPPKEVVEQIGAMFGHWPFPPISGVIGTPTMRPDGSLLLAAGYDAQTGLVLLSPPPMPSIPDHPTKRQALDSLTLLNDLLVDFPFADPASRSAAMSMALTPVLRGALGPAVPMHMVAAPQPGTGKSYLQDIVSVLATGERCAVITVSNQPEETEKRLHGAALAGYPIIALDNCNGVLSGDFLAHVTERPLLQLRPLGTSGIVRVANVFTVFANGNNISVSADLVRRTLLCTLDANMENPETRTFSLDPLAIILADRGKYLAACLTIGRAYVCAGYPGRLPPLASFERWSNLVRSSLVWLGWEDPSTGADAIRAEDPTRNARSAIFEAWASGLSVGTGYLVGELIEEAERFDSVSGQFALRELRTALLDVAKSRNSDRIDGKRLGWWLHSAAKVVAGSYKLLVDRTNASRPRWSIHEI